MKLEKTVMAVSLLSIWLLTPSARAVTTVSVTPVSSPREAGTTSGGGTKDVGHSVTLTARANPGAVFEYWSVSNTLVGITNDSTYTFTATNSETVVANFEWVVTTKASPANAGMASGGSDYTNGATVHLMAEPTNNWYNFVKWTKKDGSLLSTNALTNITVTSGEALTADFALKEVTVTTVSYPASAGKTSGGGTKTPGQTFELRATPDAGAAFINWTIGTNIAHAASVASTNNPYKYTNGITSVTVFANFGLGVTTKSSPAADGTTTSAAGGKITTNGTGHYTNNAIVTITAIANSNYFFTNWTQTGGTVFSSNATSTFTISNAEVLTANFKPKKETITTATNIAKAGHTTGAGTYAAGTKVYMTATPAAGYRFKAWSNSISGSIEVLASTNADFHFTASVPGAMTNSTNALTAYFQDDSVPTLAITSPAHGEKVGASLLEITGTANNILHVSNVVVKLGTNQVPVTTTNKWTNWWAGVLLAPGDNEISAYAVSEAGTNSATKTVKVTDTNSGLAPVSLAGLMARATNNVPSTNWFSFGMATMMQIEVSPDLGSGAGNYTYTQTGANTATLVSSYFTPPNMTNIATATNFLTFTSPTNAITTNYAGPTNTGTITFMPAPPYDVSSPAGFKVVTGTTATNTNSTTFADATFATTNVINGTNAPTVSGAYTSVQYGPLAAMIVETNGVETNYIFNWFADTSSGTWYTTTFDGAGLGPTFSFGAFTAAKSPTGEKYLAPESLNGMSVQVTPASGGKFALTAGQATLAQTGKTTNDNDTLVANYLYTRNGPSNAVLYIYDLPPSANTTALSLTFEHSGKAAWSGRSGTNVFSGTSTFSVLPQAGYFAPAAMDAGKVVLGVGASKVTMSLNDGGFTNLATPRYGSYTYTPFSPTVGMIVQTDKDTNSPGVSYLQLTFTSASAGTYYSTKPSTESVKMGSFTFTK